MNGDLKETVSTELAAEMPPAVIAFAAHLAETARRPPVAVLFYGSSVRTGDLTGLLDFYVVVERLADWREGRLRRAANRILPPNVEYHELMHADGPLKAKVAILAEDQFEALARGRGLDSSVWVRFCQPVAAPWCRDASDRDRMADTVAGAISTAAGFAAGLGPETGDPADFWQALFRRTYASELRVEGAARSGSIVAFAPARYRAVLAPALTLAGIPVEETGGGEIRPGLSRRERQRFERAWRWRRLAAKPLNLARLAKAAFTFRGGADYIVWKIARHSGEEIRLTPWQRRHPLLAAGPVLLRLWRRGVLR
ncbi:hypothetical protein [Pararhizobium mangrovi]|uniref:Phosphatidate cytidylyltransferase n=1 Tax=Pararhizobium mangrovi TaxID=2590452 RepID=A0A506U6C2_9HYPH|nr:hypothetical protein [Pararhizobium mangrovi]TPW29942.1 hypothetical protein FJU11_06665 [Pararhizobium mangrovi]